MTCKVPEVFGNSQGEFGVEILILGKRIFDDSIFGNIQYFFWAFHGNGYHFSGGNFSEEKLTKDNIGMQQLHTICLLNF